MGSIVRVEFEEGGYGTEVVLCATGEIDIRLTESHGSGVTYSKQEWEALVVRVNEAIAYVASAPDPSAVRTALMEEQK